MERPRGMEDRGWQAEGGGGGIALCKEGAAWTDIAIEFDNLKVFEIFGFTPVLHPMKRA